MSLNDLFTQRNIQHGDIGEFERLFTKYYEPLCRHANKILNDMDTSEDLVQEFFYQFWKNRETFTVRLSLNAYLYQSIRNNALHHLEHLAIRRSYAEQVRGEQRETAPAPEPQSAELNDLTRVIENTLNQMPERCSRIFRMNRFDGKKYREIAAILSISVKTVEAEMGKALQIFRKSLKDYTGNEAGIYPKNSL
ncbi:MAG: RNA polymerase sigma-70 factor [Bacteroidales bacterium]|nr:RNA polymerase sigma-70 factor [Bacteroidales bacterium]HNW72304.1 RNA polymerase sigma-70 factor [Bacteroidales bacterium]HPS51024.1 RNA polymerase sigma-70 factor [Bacteroidales bacterium]